MFRRSLLVSVVLALVVAGCTANDWRRAKSSNTIAAYEIFLREHPEDVRASEAIQAVEDLYLSRPDKDEAVRSPEDWHLQRIGTGALNGRVVIPDIRPKASYDFAAGKYTYTKEKDGTTSMGTEFPELRVRDQLQDVGWT